MMLKKTIERTFVTTEIELIKQSEEGPTKEKHIVIGNVTDSQVRKMFPNTIIVFVKRGKRKGTINVEDIELMEEEKDD